MVSVSVCASAYLENHMDKLHLIFCACCLWPLIDPSLAALQYITLYTCGFMEGVIFSHNGPCSTYYVLLNSERIASVPTEFCSVINTKYPLWVVHHGWSLHAAISRFGYAAFVLFAADNGCTYNDPRAVEYTGMMHTNEENRTCIMWSKQRAYRDSHFPDGSVSSAENFCRNPKPVDTKAWCYLSEDAARKWGYCALRQCGRC